MDLLALADHAARNDRALLFLSGPFALLLTLRLLVGLGLTRGTTLTIPWSWALVCQIVFSACVILGQAFAALSRSSDFRAWHFVAACGTLCPFVALVGAKRPQHVGWNFVVFTLWGLLALPAAEVIFLQPGQQLEINSFRSWFLVALLLAEWVNFGFTRYWLGIVWLISAQAVLLWPHLPWGHRTMLAEAREIDRAAIGGLLLATAYVFAFAAWNVKRHARGYDRLWCDFRDSFGLFWALRLMERVNDTAKQAGWDFDLGWTGFRTKQDFAPLGELPPEVERPLRNTLQGLLRRFVSDEWIAERLEAKESETTP